MRIGVKGRNVEISDSMQERIEKQFAKIGRQISELAHVDVELSEERNPSIPDGCVAAATLHLKGVTLRSEARADNMPLAVKECVDDLGRQVKRHRDKRRNRRAARAAQPPA